MIDVSRTEPDAPRSGDEPVARFDYRVDWGNGPVNGFNNVLLNTHVTGDSSGNGPTGNVYPFVTNLYEEALRSTSSAPNESQDTNAYSFVQKTPPAAGIPPGRSMRDSWNWWAQIFGANLPSSREGADIMWEHDIALNGLDDANRRAEEETIFTLKTPLGSGGYPASINAGRYLSGGSADFWAHNWFQIGGSFSHAAIDMFYASSAAAVITSVRREAPAFWVDVDDIMPLEGGGSSGGVDFPSSSTAAMLVKESGPGSEGTLEIDDPAYVRAGMFVYDETSLRRIPDGTRIAKIDGNRVSLSKQGHSEPGDELLLARGRKTVWINGHEYRVAGVILSKPGTRAGRVYFTSALPASDVQPGSRIYPNAHAIWLCNGSERAPWCDIAFDSSGGATIRGDGFGGIAVSGAGLTTPKLTVQGPVQLASFGYAALPKPGVAGREVFCSDCLKPAERAGTGTGMLVFDDGHGRWVSTAGTIAAR